MKKSNKNLDIISFNINTGNVSTYTSEWRKSLEMKEMVESVIEIIKRARFEPRVHLRDDTWMEIRVINDECFFISLCNNDDVPYASLFGTSSNIAKASIIESFCECYERVFGEEIPLGTRLLKNELDAPILVDFIYPTIPIQFDEFKYRIDTLYTIGLAMLDGLIKG